MKLSILSVALVIVGCGDRSGTEHVPASELSERSAGTPEPAPVVAEKSACDAINPRLHDDCPLDAEDVVGMTDTEDGIELRFGRDVGIGEDTLEDRIACYRAKREEQRIDRETACVIDDPAIGTDVEERDGRLFVELTAEEDRADRLRAQTRELLTSAVVDR